MSGLWKYWRDEIDANVMVIPWLVIWFVNAAMNAAMGYETGGAGPIAMLYALAFFGFAFLGAYGAKEQGCAVGGRRFALCCLVGLQLALGQMAGWQTLGLSLSRGAGQIEAKATERATTAEALQRLRGERDRIGQVRPIMTIEAERVLECKRTSRQYPDGNGPKCTALLAEEGQAKRARSIETEIADLTNKLRTGPQLKDGNAMVTVPQALFSALSAWWTPDGKRSEITPEDVRFGWLVFLVFMLEIVATLGPWLLNIGGHQARPTVAGAPRAGDAGGAAFDPRHLPRVSRRLPGPVPIHRQLDIDYGVTPGAPRHNPRASVQGPPDAYPPGGGGFATGGGATNIINVHSGGGAQPRLPPRVAAGRA